MSSSNVQPSHLEAVICIRRAARKVAKGDKYASEVVANFAERSIGCQVKPGAQLVCLENGKRHPQMVPFVIVFPAEVPWLGHEPPSHMYFRPPGQMFFIYRAPWTQEYLGIVALHEMIHWDDLMVTKREKLGPSFSDEWVMGEVRAHKVELAAIGRWVGKVWSQTCSDVARDDSMLLRVQDGIRLPTLEGIRKVVAVMPVPPLCRDEQSMRLSAAIIAIFFAQCANDLQKAAAYRLLIGIGPDIAKW